MAREPQVIPFAETMPSDEFQVEKINDDEVLIGDPSLDEIEVKDTGFDENLAEEIDAKELNGVASELISCYESDKEARSEWEFRYKQGLETLDPQGGQDEEENQRASRGLSTVVHPMIAEAATQFNARAIAELYPSGGPVKTVIVGDPNEEMEEQAKRVKDYMNYQISPESKDLYTSTRYTHVIRMPRNDFNKYVQAGFYLPSKYSSEDIDPSGDIGSEIEGVDPYNSEAKDEVMTLLEMHCYQSFDGIDEDNEQDEDNVVHLPYVVTIDYDSEKIVAVRRNWEEADERKKRRDWFISYKFLPGTGFYGFGLYHMIGGLGKAATGSLRALLDSAAFANMQGGFKLKGRVTGGEMQINPGEFADLDATVDDVNKAIMPLPFKEPSGTLFNLMNAITDIGRRFANTADLNVGDVNPNAPVGSTVALIEQGSKSFSAIHKRLHYSQGQEFKLLAKLNAEYLPEEFKFAQSGVDTIIYAKDFNDRIDIIPVSDPNIFSTAQRIAQAQAVLQMSQSAPQLHDQYEAYKRMYEAIRINNIDEVLKKPEEASKLDPITENMSLMYGKPIRAFPEQDHESHIAVHMQFISDPSLAGNPGARSMQPLLIAHIAEHIALLYRQRMQASINMSLPGMPDIRDPKFKFEDIDPALDMAISQRAAEVVKQAPQMEAIKPLVAMSQQQQQNNPLQYAQELAKLEAEALKARTQVQIEADQAKAQQKLAINEAEAKQDMQIEQAKLQQELQAKVAKLELELQLEREKNAIKLQKELR